MKVEMSRIYALGFLCLLAFTVTFAMFPAPVYGDGETTQDVPPDPTLEYPETTQDVPPHVTEPEHCHILQYGYPCMED